jgi:hypothetical protein
MGQVAALLANGPRRPPGFGLAVVLSAALHGLFALFLWAFPGVYNAVGDDQPLREVLVSIADDDGILSLTAVSLPAVRSAAPSVADGGEEQAEPIRVGPLTPSPASPPDTDEAPHLQGAPQRSNGPGRGTGAANKAGTADPTFFGVPMRAQRIVFVIDRSTSMWANGGLEAAKRELLASLERLPADARFQVLFYNGLIETLPGAERDGYLEITELTRRNAVQMIEKVRPSGSTNHLAALRQALALKPDVIFLATDGEDLRLDQVRDLTDLNRGRAVIHTLQWDHSKQGSGLLNVLAEWNRGTHRRIDRSSS